MAKKSPSESTTNTSSKIKQFLSSDRTRVIFGLLLLSLTFYTALSLVSFLFTGGADQSKLEFITRNELFARNNGIQNWGGAVGAFLSEYLVNQTFGIGAALVVFFFGALGAQMVTRKPIPLVRYFVACLLGVMWLSLFFATFFQWLYKDWFIYLGGKLGDNLTELLQANIGLIGTIILIAATLLVSLVVTSNRFMTLLLCKPTEKPVQTTKKPTALRSIFSWFKREAEANEANQPTKSTPPSEKASQEIEWVINSANPNPQPTITERKSPAFEVVTPQQEESIDDDLPLITSTPDEADEGMEEMEDYDPTLDLSGYKYPTFDLLQKYDLSELPVRMEELTANKNRITEVLRNFSIEIVSIKATPGPTVTLYEIVPEAGIRIAKIRNLEDDIALSLSALGIRIIAPIPGKGTIGIEVPNKEPQIVPMRAILSSEKFQNQKMELPVALGKTITNDTFIVDLCKMPHVLVAGATGQGKSVGLNAIITSLLYKKHPSQLKFVLIDPKKVEFPIYSTIEKHFLAKLPDGDEAIITDVTKVVQTLTSLTREMDERYDLLNMAQVRNVKEYNIKFVTRKLNPERGHRFMPYIVVVIDEFGDLIMTAGKEIELPIARIAQLARAVGIHMIIATQRPSTNIITGTIKANFPARVAFRVSSMIDSRTILDCPGANQLIGRGDMLVSQGGGDLVRVQCAFIDTPEVENVAKFIGDQRGYPTAYLLPEPLSEEGAVGKDIDMKNLDSKFEEAARLIVVTQQGSTSLIQRKMELGYNRAGRIMDQLEAAGVVGPSEGSKPRQVLVTDEIHLEMILKTIK